jgi:dephospho-CoA kinase
MLSVGLTGGIGTGKSTVAGMFRELGCRVLDSDLITRELFQPGDPVNAGVVEAFGPSVVAQDGSIDRVVLGNLVFNNEELRLRLNSIVHPAIRERQKQFLDAAAREHPNGIAMVEAALMVEVGTYANYDRLIVVVSTPAVQRSRLRARSGLSADQIEARIASQMPLEEKAKFADFIVENSDGLDATRRQVQEIYGELRTLAMASGDGGKRS